MVTYSRSINSEPALPERLFDLDRPDDLARWPGPLE